ncbi:MAG TPA: hypothetical protein VGM74_17080 [Burkholderiaceae bacterium]
MRIPARDRWYAGLIWLAACGLGADWSGLHYMVGAFIAGAVMDAVMIIFSNMLLDKAIITNEAFTALLLMAVGSTMLSVPVVAPMLARMKELVFRAS